MFNYINTGTTLPFYFTTLRRLKRPRHKMEVSGQFYAPANLPQGDTAPGIHCTAGWVGPRVSLDAVENI
jgi:hypothetical protein